MKDWIINIILLTYLIEFSCTIFIGIFFLIYSQEQYIDLDKGKNLDCVLIYFLFVFGYFFIVLIATIMLIINIVFAGNITHLRWGMNIIIWRKLSCLQELHIAKGWCIYTGTKFTLMCVMVIFQSIKISTKIVWFLLILVISEVIMWSLLRPLKLIQMIRNSEKLPQDHIGVEKQEHGLSLNNVATKVDIDVPLREGMGCDPT